MFTWSMGQSVASVFLVVFLNLFGAGDFVEPYKDAMVFQNSVVSFQMNGIIFISESQINNGKLKHEYGHYIQQRKIDPEMYMPVVGLTSIIGNILAGLDVIDSDGYYNLSTERWTNIEGAYTVPDCYKGRYITNFGFYLNYIILNTVSNKIRNRSIRSIKNNEN